MSYTKAAKHLCKVDPKIAKIVKRFGVCDWKPEERCETVFEYMARSIVYQQLNGRVATKIFLRYVQLFNRRAAPDPDAPEHNPWLGLKHPHPKRVAAADVEFLRSAGLSIQKATYIKGLAQQCLDGLPTMKQLESMEDEEIIEELIQIKGVGRWTVEMLLLFRMGRMDVWPVDDYGVRSGLKKFQELETLPKPKEAMAMGEMWRPYRSAAAFYMWRLMDTETPE